ncbi:hypothetical protein [Helicobacter bizzozeronii]|uniref:hypothetical protein n=1 Tax=Helicobacter bizzozeronii TaxID=56877 RepID=UPI000CEEB483|nr:hypothetical protein [Helicobacter bizzozeronii]
MGECAVFRPQHIQEQQLMSLSAQIYLSSFFNKNRGFDRTVGEFKKPDLFSFLENLVRFDYQEDFYYTDFFYILDYTAHTIEHLLEKPLQRLYKEYRIDRYHKAKELDYKCLQWLNNQEGKTVRQKLHASQGKAMYVQRTFSLNNHENRLFAIFLKRLLETLGQQHPLLHKKFRKLYSSLFARIENYLNSPICLEILRMPFKLTNIILYDTHHYKIYKAYQWLLKLQEKPQKKTFDKARLFALECLYHLHFFTNTAIRPLSYEEVYANPWDALADVPLAQKLRSLDSNIPLKSKFAKMRGDVLGYLKTFLALDQDKRFKPPNAPDRMAIDFFRLAPLCYATEQTIKFPIIIKKAHRSGYINANNAQILPSNLKDLYTLPKVLTLEHMDKFPMLLQELQRLLEYQDASVAYLIPDYFQDFTFLKTLKTTMNAYFKHATPLAKSFAATYAHLLQNPHLKIQDTLLFIQKDAHNKLHVTPILIKKSPKDSGLRVQGKFVVLERWPTHELPDTFQTQLEGKASECYALFLHNGMKAIQNILVEEQEGLQNFKKWLNQDMYFSDKQKIYDGNIRAIQKTCYPQAGYAFLFKKGKTFILPPLESEALLVSAQTLVALKDQGKVAYKEHLPNLSMQYFNPKLSYFDQFTLVKKDTLLEGSKIVVEDSFTLHKGYSQHTFGITLDNKPTKYQVALKIPDEAIGLDLECEVALHYDYERENAYEFYFTPNDESLGILKGYIEEKPFDPSIYPDFPKTTPDLARTIKEAQKILDEVLNQSIETLHISENVCSILRERHCDEIAYITFERELENGPRKAIFRLQGKYKEDEKKRDLIEKLLRQTEYYGTLQINKDRASVERLYFSHLEPLEYLENQLQKIFNHDRTISDLYPHIPQEIFRAFIKAFKKNINKLIQKAKSLAESLGDNPDSIPQEIQAWLKCVACLGQLLDSSDRDFFAPFLQKDHKSLARFLASTRHRESFRDCLLELYKNERSNRPYIVFSIALWHSPEFHKYFRKKDMQKLLEGLLEKMKINFKKLTGDKRAIGFLISNINLLLGLLRADRLQRQQNQEHQVYLEPDTKHTQAFISLIDKIAKFCLKHALEFRASRDKFNLDELQSEIKESPVSLAIVAILYLNNDKDASLISIKDMDA